MHSIPAATDYERGPAKNWLDFLPNAAALDNSEGGNQGVGRKMEVGQEDPPEIMKKKRTLFCCAFFAG